MVQYARHLYNRDEALEESFGSDHGSSDDDAVETSTLSNRKIHRNKLQLVKVKASRLALKDAQLKDLLARIRTNIQQLIVEGCIRIEKEGYNKMHKKKISGSVTSGPWTVNITMKPETCKHFQELRFGHWQSENQKGPSLFTRELYFDTRKGMNKLSESAADKPSGDKPSDALFLSDEEDNTKENLRVKYKEFQYLRGVIEVVVEEFPLA
ncbi:hypothetical protein B0I72DRAFT_18273 [Yarrowia lipolytica]|jgi:hypothetical protein|uniref:YALI0C11319p n=3 Tax=Yarrowia lipolytica TaxID=4952 RepID=Q6CC95_YARLI|nr:YALI0C11319p [Yarrowia lipolytica CLIB122]KAB8282428.1 hypothetical protein BKA91DRAFT_24342 [Yarrowia lipolytica]KAE8169738.1 hypothetical protein BKA90DRAFT_45374 [Yarrowia lipolytica]KAJ8053335.1 hypothetical protein LXG23DRAFT_54928 [Yarrowia lipolytica]RDW22983.1 hypothetical protein B0I71DRAFT_19124 [Yarrowia lipolytica]RDW29771.1 hypothetical protein B0I72DRAFT_18273 [Yarrowia lipolytica]|eukprot:XP_501717.1 YALI0C11319p [Yarrowia lipolytica CLIB122]